MAGVIAVKLRVTGLLSFGNPAYSGSSLVEPAVVAPDTQHYHTMLSAEAIGQTPVHTRAGRRFFADQRRLFSGTVRCPLLRDRGCFRP